MQMCDQFPVTRTLQNSLQNLKQEIYRYQLTMFPLCANTFLLYLCFMTWASGVYAHTYDDEQNLRHSILANYTPGIRPVIQQSQPTTVMVEFRLMEILSFDDRAGVLKTICILTLQWMDEKIRWNASMYDIYGCFFFHQLLCGCQDFFSMMQQPKICISKQETMTTARFVFLLMGWPFTRMLDFLQPDVMQVLCTFPSTNTLAN